MGCTTVETVDKAVIREPSPPLEEGDSCGDLRIAPTVYYGTLEPTYLPMTSEQILAVGSFDGCSGILIAPRWVLTASHCRLRRRDRFCVGAAPDAPSTCLRIERVINHDGNDIALVELREEASNSMEGIVPVPIFTGSMDQTWIGERVEAAGYGQMENGESGVRKFTAEQITELTPGLVTIFGDGQRGVCFGDSGGPLMALELDGTVRVVGVLSYGDESCVGYDTFTRVDAHREWIESYTGPTLIPNESCGEITTTGRCLGNQAVWCEGELLQTEVCPSEAECGWDSNANGFRCIETVDPCDGVDGYGECVDGVAHWCESGVLRARDCTACQQLCQVIDSAVGVYCVDDPCKGLDLKGQCNGMVVEWCDEGVFKSKNCEDDGKVCGWYNDDYGYACIEP